MAFLKKIGVANLFLLAICVLIIIASEYLFLNGQELHGIFIGLWAPTLLGIAIFLKQITNGK
ncbi:MAG: hypothetical protein NWQ38_14030 [Cellulophaga sp.]|nr:hypothetical protein [Cellulophaga sp.]